MPGLRRISQLGGKCSFCGEYVELRSVSSSSEITINKVTLALALYFAACLAGMILIPRLS